MSHTHCQTALCRSKLLEHSTDDSVSFNPPDTAYAITPEKLATASIPADIAPNAAREKRPIVSCRDNTPLPCDCTLMRPSSLCSLSLEGALLHSNEPRLGLTHTLNGHKHLRRQGAASFEESPPVSPPVPPSVVPIPATYRPDVWPSLASPSPWRAGRPGLELRSPSDLDVAGGRFLSLRLVLVRNSVCEFGRS